MNEEQLDEQQKLGDEYPVEADDDLL